MAVAISWFMGIKAFLIIQLPVVLIAHVFGLFLFYVQHQFDEVWWDREGKWDYKTAALQGSSFLKLPVILQWFTGNIGFHHVHHLSSKIPNYKLERCHNENEIFHNVKPITVSTMFKSLDLNLWDEQKRQMVSFRQLRLAEKSM